MKIREDLMLCKVGESSIVMSTGSAIHMSGLTTLNDTGEFIWQQLQNDTTEDAVVDALCAEFDIDVQTAQSDAHEFIQMLQKAGFLV